MKVEKTKNTRRRRNGNTSSGVFSSTSSSRRFAPSRLSIWAVSMLLGCPTLSSQVAQPVDFKTGDARLRIHPYQKEVSGTVVYTFRALQPVDSVFVNARKMTIEGVQLDGEPALFHYTGERLWVRHSFVPKKTYRLAINYTAHPAQALYFEGWGYAGARRQVWTQGQGKYTSHWLPSFDDPNEKVIFSLAVAFPDGYTVVSNGELLGTEKKDSITNWRFAMKQPMSSYLVAIAAGKYASRTLFSRSRVPLQLYYYPEDSLKVEPTYRYAERLFDFLEREIGLAYPWKVYRQVSVRDFMYAGMENTTVTIFSDEYVVDSTGFFDRNYVNVHAHELAHQWFGNWVTAQRETHHWLQEGFATYYALLAERAVFGTDYYYEQLYQSAEALLAASREGKGERLLDSAAGTLTFYDKGAWALHALRERVGDGAFRKGVRRYLKKYKYGSATTGDFIAVMERASGKKLGEFVATWLENPVFPEAEVLESLRKNAVIKGLLDLKEVREPEQLLRAFSEGNAPVLNEAILTGLKGTDTEGVRALYQKILQSQWWHERQVVVATVEKISPELKAGFEALLGDKSYLTMERALYLLWSEFPQDRFVYLNRTKGVWGLPEGNVRLLWLTLALLTPDYELENQPRYYEELSGYTSPFYSYQVRELALIYLYRMGGLADENLKDLLSACLHPAWEFAKNSRDLLGELLQNPTYKIRFRSLSYKLDEPERAFLEKKLGL